MMNSKRKSGVYLNNKPHLLTDSKDKGFCLLTMLNKLTYYNSLKILIKFYSNALFISA